MKTEIKTDRVREALRPLAAMFPFPEWTPEALAVYVTGLERFPIEKINRGVKRMLESRKRIERPTLADITESILGYSLS